MAVNPPLSFLRLITLVGIGESHPLLGVLQLGELKTGIGLGKGLMGRELIAGLFLSKCRLVGLALVVRGLAH